MVSMPLVYRSHSEGYRELASIMSKPRHFDHNFPPMASAQADVAFRRIYPKVDSGVAVLAYPSPRMPQPVEDIDYRRASPRTVEAAKQLVGLSNPLAYGRSARPSHVDRRLSRELSKLATSHRRKPFASIIDCGPLGGLAALELPPLHLDRMAVSFLAPSPFELIPSPTSAFERVGGKRARAMSPSHGRPAKLRAMAPAADGVPELSLGAPSAPSMAELMACLPAFSLADPCLARS